MKAKTIAQLFAVLLFVALPIGWLVGCSTSSHRGIAFDRQFHRESEWYDNTTPLTQPILDEVSLAARARRAEISPQQLAAPAEAPTPPQIRRSEIFTIQPGEEIWIIAKPSQHVADNVERGPGSGSLIATVPVHHHRGADGWQRDDEPVEVPLPLKHTDVKANIAGYIATVDVTQQFHNPYSSKIEAVYQFPLPQDAAVSEFVMEVGPPHARHKIRGVIRDKEEAKRLYESAKRHGHNAALLEQVRPNIFEQKVANIEPGKQIDIQIRYFNTLQYRDGWYEFVFPMVVGPRYNPPYSDDPVGAVGHGHGWRSDLSRNAGGTTISYLRPNQRSGHDIALSLDIDAGVSIEQAECITHAVNAQQHPFDANQMSLSLASSDRIPNKDFVFRFRVAGKQMKTGLIKHVDADGRGYFSLMLVPPADLQSLERQPMEMVFVVDCSGSMKGDPMRQCKEAMHHALRQLRPDDTFQIIRFSDDASTFRRRPVPASATNLRKAERYIDRLSGQGGTRMIEGVKASLDFPQDPHRYRVVTFMTDGKIGNEAEILKAMAPRIKDTRVFSFGVGSSVNRYMLERMAKVGRGAAAYLLPNDSGKQVMDLYFDRVSRPVLTDVAIGYGSAQVAEVYPQRLPDVFVGRPIIVTGRYSGDLKDLSITGRVAGQRVSLDLDGHDTASHPALGQVWARRKIMGLMDTMHTQGHTRLEREVRDTALAYNLVSAYTSFIAVDASRYTAGRSGTTVRQALPVPEGVEYDTTVGN